MQYRHPPCGDSRAHPEHWEHRLGLDGSHCPGWTEAEADTVALITLLNKVADDILCGYLTGEVRLECHPSVRHSLIKMVIPGYAEFVSGAAEPWKPAQVTVVVSAEMKPGEWRLVLADGRIR